MLQIRRGKRDNLRIIFLVFPINLLAEVVLMRGHNICFFKK